MDKYVKRLYEEWKKHGKIILSTDFDDTIFPYSFEEKDLQDTIELIKEVYLVGAYVVIFTASDKSRYEEILNYCTKIQIPVHAINQNPINLLYGKEGKIYYNINLCDRSGLDEAKRILREAMYAIKGGHPEKINISEFEQFKQPYTT